MIFYEQIVKKKKFIFEKYLRFATRVLPGGITFLIKEKQPNDKEPCQFDHRHHMRQ